MKQQEFLNQLKSALEKHGVKNLSDVLSDYQEHFTHGLQNGKSEEEIAAKLGSPATIAKAYETESLIEQMKNPHSQFQWHVALKVIGRLLVIAPFNLLVLFIPGMIMLGVLTAGWSVVAAFGSGSAAILWFGLTAGVTGISGWAIVSVIFASFGVFGLAVITAGVMFLISKYVLLAVINYLQWNLQFILEK